MSLQCRSFFALRGAAPNFAQTSPAPDFSLCGGNRFTLSCTFYTEHPQDEGVFIKQGDLFSMGMENGAVYFSSKRLGRIQSVAPQTPLSENNWNNVAVVYDGNELSLYLQGQSVAKKTVGAGERLVDNTLCYQMGLLEGYLLDVKLYSNAFTAAQARKDQFVTQATLEQTELLADFDGYIPEDKGRHKLAIRLIGALDTVNLVNSLHCDKDSVAQPAGGAPVNPGAADCPAYTLMVKLYPTLGQAEGDRYLFSNGALDKADTVALGLCDQQSKPFFVLGKQRFLFAGVVAPGSWTDLAVSVSGQTVVFYLDGVPSGSATLPAPFTRQSPAELRFANIFSGKRFSNGFCGYLDSVSIFSAALPAQRILAYASVAPYGFDADLAALWSFYDYEAIEVKHGGAVSLAGGAEVSPCENTVLDRIAPPLTITVPDIPTGLSELEIWKANTAMKAFTLAVKELTGMEPQGCYTSQGNLLGSLCRVAGSAFEENDSISTIEIEGKAEKSTVADLIKYTVIAAEIGLFCYGLYRLYGYRRLKIMHKYLCVSVSVMSTTLLGVYLENSPNEVNDYVHSHKAPDSDKGGGAEYDISLVSLAFYNSVSADAGALCARPDFSHPPVVPEWVHTVKPSAPALYYRSIPTGKTPVLRAVFRITLKISGSVTVKVGASAHDYTPYNAMLGTLPEQSFTMSTSGEHTVDFPMSANTLRQAALGAAQVSWGWYYKTSGRHFLKNTEHMVHIINDKPLSPWTTALASAYLPVYPLLELCVGIVSGADRETDPNKHFANQLVDWSHKGARFTPRGWQDSPRYARWDNLHKRLTVDVEKYTTALRGTTAVSVTSLDLACLGLLLARLEGLGQLRLLEMKPVLERALALRDCKGMDGSTLPSDFVSFYSACGIADADRHFAVWDAFATLRAPDGTDFVAKGVPFATYPITQDCIAAADKAQYHTLLCCQGGSCQVAVEVQRLFVGTLPLKRIVPGIPGSSIAGNKDRPDFDTNLKKMLDIEATTVRCHSISYHYIQTGIIFLVNRFLSKQITLAQCVVGLRDLVIAISGYTQHPATGAGTTWAITAWDALEKDGAPVSLCCQLNLFEKLGDNAFAGISPAADRLLTALNNCPYNLRLAMSDWNSAIGEDFDCKDWIHVYTTEEGTLCADCSCAEQICDTSVVIKGLPPISTPGFFITNIQDSVRLAKLKSLCDEPLCVPPIDFSQAAFSSGKGAPNLRNPDSNTNRCFLYSSDNSWRKAAGGLSHICHENIYFVCNGVWARWPTKVTEE